MAQGPVTFATVDSVQDSSPGLMLGPFESVMLSTVTRSRVKCTSQPSTKAGSPSLTGGNG